MLAYEISDIDGCALSTTLQAERKKSSASQRLYGSTLILLRVLCAFSVNIIPTPAVAESVGGYKALPFPTFSLLTREERKVRLPQ